MNEARCEKYARPLFLIHHREAAGSDAVQVTKNPNVGELTWYAMEKGANVLPTVL